MDRTCPNINWTCPINHENIGWIIAIIEGNKESFVDTFLHVIVDQNDRKLEILADLSDIKSLSLIATSEKRKENNFECIYIDYFDDSNTRPSSSILEK